MMPPQPLVFLGAAHAFNEISVLIDDLNRVEPRYTLVAVLDDDPQTHGRRLRGVPVAGGLEQVSAYPEAQFVFGIGSFRTRLKRLSILARLQVPEERFATLVHPAAKVYPEVCLGAGCVVHFGSVLCTGAELEPFSIVMWNSVITSASRLCRTAMVASTVTIMFGAHIGAGAFVGASSCVGEEVRVGPGALVGAGAMVVHAVPPGAVVVGNPARIIRREPVPDDLLTGWRAGEAESPEGHAAAG